MYVFMDMNIYNQCYEQIDVYNIRGDVKMSEALNKICGITAKELLEKYGDSDKLPIELTEILKNLNISAISMDFADIEQMPEMQEKIKEKGSILGTVFSVGDVTAIFYKKDDSLNRQRFTIAHELAHCCLNAQHLQSGHIEFRNDSQSSEPNEIACNTFAGELLIPEDAVMELHNTLLFKDAASLSKIFGVSKNVMEKRLEVLNLI